MNAAMSTAIQPGSDALATDSLTQAFRCFNEAAQSLERSYGLLEVEVARLRQELEERSGQLACSLEENGRMRDSFYDILAGLPCGVLVSERSNRLSLVNPAASRLLAVQAPIESMEQLPSVVRTALERAAFSSGDWELQIGTGTEGVRSIAIRHTPLGDKEQKSVFLLEDVSERKRIARERERIERDRALAEMAAILAHEIRNPLGSLELFAGLLAESNLEQEHKTWVEQMQAGLRMLGATVNNVLHFHNHPRPQLAPTDMGQVLGWICEFLRPLAKQSGLRLELENGLCGIEFSADRHRLEQVLLNLAVNGMRFTPTGGTLRISGRIGRSAARREIEIEVADSGPGIPDENLPRVFDPGYTTRCGSPGLGLTVCRTIVEQHGGRILAENRKAGGAIFHLRFPLGEKE